VYVKPFAQQAGRWDRIKREDEVKGARKKVQWIAKAGRDKQQDAGK